ncbi:MAG: glucose-6-phosphate isomerase [Rhodospirillales bacterium]
MKRSSAWQALADHQKTVAPLHLRELFSQDPRREAEFSREFPDFYVDFSKHRVTRETMALLCALAREAALPEWIKKLFSGAQVNSTEHRSVLHTALREPAGTPRMLGKVDVGAEVARVLARMRKLSDEVRDGVRLGATGEHINDVVHIGIGGSLLGPQVAVEALAAYAHPRLKIHFIGNVDSAPIASLLSGLDPAKTLFIIASKTFTTEETLVNADTARVWLETKLGGAAVAKHFVAVTANQEGAAAFGIVADNVFEFWDWVGGRFSMWSSIGLPIVLAIGMDRFQEMLAGAHEMDRHFAETPLEQNLPATLGLLAVWYNNFFGWGAHAVLPYDEGLRQLPAYLQQAEMESNGKSVDRDGKPVGCDTAPVVWGGTGTNSQHAFFQMLHQGTRIVPCDFIVSAQSGAPLPRHQDLLVANCFAQTEALMLGRTAEEVAADLQSLPDAERAALVPHRTFAGNRPSTTILMRRLDPRALGLLIALYEHKVFVQGVIWDVNSFDQWGVELGKKLAKRIVPELEGELAREPHDASTSGLIVKYREWR